jgi:hypothetical protein
MKRQYKKTFFTRYPALTHLPLVPSQKIGYDEI